LGQRVLSRGAWYVGSWTPKPSSFSDYPVKLTKPKRSWNRISIPKSGSSRAADPGSAPGDRRSDLRQTQRLAAILAADVAGYSRLMGADEESTGLCIHGDRPKGLSQAEV